MPGTFDFFGFQLPAMTFGELFLIVVGLELLLAFGVTVAAHFTSGIVRAAVIALAVLLGALVLLIVVGYGVALGHAGRALPA
jgi:hypothetical protein